MRDSGIGGEREPMSTHYEHIGCDQRNVTEKSKMERKELEAERETIKTTVRLFGVGDDDVRKKRIEMAIGL